MKRKIALMVICLLLCGCTTKKKQYVDVIEPQMIDFSKITYNTDEPLKNVEIKIELDLENAYLVHLVNDSSNCYDQIDYKIGDFTGSFKHVAAYSENYDVIRGRGEIVEITNYQLSNHLIYNASSYIQIKTSCNLEEKTLGKVEYQATDRIIYGDFIVLWNQHYISHATLGKDGLIPKYEESDEEVDTKIYLELENDEIYIENNKPDGNYYFGQVTLYPRYFVMEEE